MDKGSGVLPVRAHKNKQQTTGGGKDIHMIHDPVGTEGSYFFLPAEPIFFRCFLGSFLFIFVWSRTP